MTKDIQAQFEQQLGHVFRRARHDAELARNQVKGEAALANQLGNSRVAVVMSEAMEKVGRAALQQALEKFDKALVLPGASDGRLRTQLAIGYRRFLADLQKIGALGAPGGDRIEKVYVGCFAGVEFRLLDTLQEHIGILERPYVPWWKRHARALEVLRWAVPTAISLAALIVAITKHPH